MTPFCRLLRRAAAALAISLTMAFAPSLTCPAAAAGYAQHNLVSDMAGVADFMDPNLVNSWGITQSPTGPFWIADNHTGVSTIYDGNGMAASLVVTIPPPPGSSDAASPTGIVYNDTFAFFVRKGSRIGPSRFIFATEDGTISGWNPDVDATNAIRMVNRPSAVYKGLTRIGTFLFAANFAESRIDVFDGAFRFLGFFHNPFIPAGFAPFNVRAFDSVIVVTYAKQKPDKHDDEAGPGNGFVSVLNPFAGTTVRFATMGTLNSPWGIALAPAGFGPFSGDLLIGNFGDGAINAFDPRTGAFRGQLKDPSGNVIIIDGLWGLRFGNGAAATSPSVLYFTAGPGGEEHGLFGRLRYVP